MNIAFVSPQMYPCHTGGLEVFNYYLIKELAARGHTLWIITRCDHKWTDKNIHCAKLLGFHQNTTIHTMNLSITHKLIKLNDQIDIVHVPYTSNSYLAYPILFVHKLSSIPYIITIHGGGMYEWKQKLLQKLFFNNAANIIAVSEVIKEEYEKRSGREIIVIPPLIPFTELKNSKNEMKKKYDFTYKDRILLSLGSIKKIKGSDILLNAFLRLGREYIKETNLKLLFVGDGSMKLELKKKVDKNNLHEHVKFYGNVTREKVPEIYKLADIYIIPSLFEGTPISLLEAKYNGLPIIGANVKGINTMITHGKNGLLFEEGNSDDLKNKLIELLNDPIKANILGISAKSDYFRGYKFEDMISDHIDIYKKAIEI